MHTNAALVKGGSKPLKRPSLARIQNRCIIPDIIPEMYIVYIR